MRDELGDRMKKNYENRTRILLPRRTYTIIRIDGKAFHTYTKGCVSPFDNGLIEDMDLTSEYLCKNIQGAKIGFVQSDEISILMTDFDNLQTDAWFDGNIQKIVSIAASMATAKFNQLRLSRWFRNYDEDFDNLAAAHFVLENRLAEFDARTYTIPSKTEVMNYFIWRQQDTVRNSISSVAQSLYSAKELHGKNMSEQQEMIFRKGINWNDYSSQHKRGRFVYKSTYEKEGVTRSKWLGGSACPTFSKEPDFLNLFIPDME